jgi:hypothetical protein
MEWLVFVPLVVVAVALSDVARPTARSGLPVVYGGRPGRLREDGRADVCSTAASTSERTTVDESVTQCGCW